MSFSANPVPPYFGETTIGTTWPLSLTYTAYPASPSLFVEIFQTA
jgi:hypothetical protein